MYPMTYGFWGGGALGWVSMVFWWVLIFVIILALIRWFGACHRSKYRYGTDEKSPLEISRERYAKGEVDKDKFREIKKELEQTERAS